MKPRLVAKSERAPVDTVVSHGNVGGCIGDDSGDGGGGSGSSIAGLQLGIDSKIGDSSSSSSGGGGGSGSGASPSFPLSVLSDSTYLPPPPTVAEGGKGAVTTGREVRASTTATILLL